jgi:hypothetical protein
MININKICDIYDKSKKYICHLILSIVNIIKLLFYRRWVGGNLKNKPSRIFLNCIIINYGKDTETNYLVHNNHIIYYIFQY